MLSAASSTSTDVHAGLPATPCVAVHAAQLTAHPKLQRACSLSSSRHTGSAGERACSVAGDGRRGGHAVCAGRERFADEQLHELGREALEQGQPLQSLEDDGRIRLADGDQLLVEHNQLLHVVPELGRLAVGHLREDARRRLVCLDDHVPAQS